MWLYIPLNTLGGIVHTLAPYSNALPTSLTLRMDAASISVYTFCLVYTLAMSLTRHRPPNELSSTLPTNGETYFAPALADSIACDGEKISVTFTLTAGDSCLQTHRPSGVQGTLIVAFLPNLLQVFYLQQA